MMGLVNKFRDHVDNLAFKDRLIYECHSICRAIAKAMPSLRLVDGNYMGLQKIPNEGSFGFELRYAAHSWLETPDEAIIDPYPVGILAANPVLVVNKGQYAPFGGQLYVADPRVTAEISTRKTWRKAETFYRLLQASQK